MEVAERTGRRVEATMDFAALAIKEVDMGFLDRYEADKKGGFVLKAGCQRIHHCSCDCNRCVRGTGSG